MIALFLTVCSSPCFMEPSVDEVKAKEILEAAKAQRSAIHTAQLWLHQKIETQDDSLGFVAQYFTIKAYYDSDRYRVEVRETPYPKDRDLPSGVIPSIQVFDGSHVKDRYFDGHAYIYRNLPFR